MSTTNYKIFIASSLSLRKDRQDVADAVEDVNNVLRTQNRAFEFSTFDYVKDDRIVQKIEMGDAQEPVIRFLHESLVFVLIVRGRIGNLTISEFEGALKRYKEGRFPQYIFIFYDEDKSRDEINDKNSIPFTEFENRYLVKCELDSAYRLITHKTGYYIPFGGENFNGLKEQLTENLLNLINSEEWPIPGSIRNIDLKKADFYTDENRLDQCYKGIYFQRQFDTRLENAIENKQIIFINGSSLSGKTRAVMNSLSSKDAGWTYIFPNAEANDRNEAVMAKMSLFLDYFGKQLQDSHSTENGHAAYYPHPLHYVFIDDIHHEIDIPEEEDGDPKSKRQRKTVERFLSAAAKGMFKLIVTSTRKFQDTFLYDFISEDESTVQLVPIGEMSESEFLKAKNFFCGYGLIKHDRHFAYRTPGALLMDLTKIEKAYKDYLNTKKDRILTTRRSLLKAIKATSIWKQTNFGELSLLRSLTRYFAEEEDINDLKEKEIDNAINDLVKPRCGVTRTSESCLNIQEYVCYLIDYDGNLGKGDGCLPDEEKHLVRELLSYCAKNYDTQAPLTMQACKLGSRSDHKDVIGPWLFHIFLNDGQQSEPEKDWIKTLLKEKEENEAYPLPEEKSNYLFYYSKMFSNAFCAETGFQDALAIFKRSTPSLRSPNLLADLIRYAKTKEDWEEIHALDEYQKYAITEKRPFVLTRLMFLQKDFAHTLSYFNELAQGFDDHTAAAIAKYRIKSLGGPIKEDSDRKIKGDIYPIESGLETLALKVASEKDFERLLEIIRKYYCVKINDKQLLKSISDRTLDINAHSDDLTIVDLLSVLETVSLRKAIQGAFGPKSDDTESRRRSLLHARDYLEKTVFTSFPKTLRNAYTDETRLRRTGSVIINALIEVYGKSKEGLDFHTLRDTIVRISTMPHPLAPEREMKLMDCYAYNFMLQTKGCGALETREILEEGIMPRISDHDNPIVLSVELLNSMISTIWREKRTDENQRKSIIRRILPLYKQFHIHQDNFTYNILINSSINEKEAIGYISSMAESGIRPDLYSFCSLSNKLDDIQGVLSLIRLPDEIGLPEGYEIRKVLPDSVLHPASDDEQADGQKDILLDSEEYWEQVFYRKLKTDDDRFVAKECLNYLKDHKPGMLADGKLLNVIIKNKTNIIDLESVTAFIEDNKSETFPDSYTITNLTFRLSELAGADKRKHLDYYNELTEFLYKTGRLDWDRLLVERLRLFSSFGEQLSLAFLSADGDGTFHSEKVSAIGCLKIMKANNAKVDLRALHKNLRSIQGYDKNKNQIEKIYPYSPRYSHNLKVVESLKNDMPQNLQDAVRLLDWEDYTSAVQAFNMILDLWSRKNVGNADRFVEIKKIYETYFSEKAPNSETFSRLVKLADSYSDVTGYIYPAFDSAKKKRPELRLDSHFLSSVYRFSKCPKDLKDFTQVFMQKGGDIQLANAVSMTRHLLKFDHDAEASSLLGNIFQYLFRDGSNAPLELYGPPLSMISRENINGNLLYSAIVYAENNLLLKRRDIVDILLERYQHSLLDFNDNGLLPQLRTQGRVEDSKNFLSYILTLLMEREKIDNIPDNLLATAVEGLKEYSHYCRFILAMRKSGNEAVEPIVAPLLIKLRSWMKQPKDKKGARELYSRIITYSKINYLKNEHLLPSIHMLSTEDHWSGRRMDCSFVRSVVDEIVGVLTLKKQIEYAIQNLPMPYTLTLKYIYYGRRKRLEVEDDTKHLVRNFESQYARMIIDGQIDFDDIVRLPNEWERSGWIPGKELLAALYTTYGTLSKSSSDTAIREEANRYHAAMSKIISAAKAANHEYIRFYYNEIGRLEKPCGHYVSVSRKDFRYLTR